MRVANWNVQKAAELIKSTVWHNVHRLSADQAVEAKRRCPVGDKAESNKRFRPTKGKNAGVLTEFRSNGRTTREGKFVEARVRFVRSSGRKPNGKGSIADFKAKRWTGRYPGQLRDTIRVVDKPGSGNVRVYAGNFKVYYSLFVERGTIKMTARPFLRPSFHKVKAKAMAELKKGL